MCEEVAGRLGHIVPDKTGRVGTDGLYTWLFSVESWNDHKVKDFVLFRVVVCHPFWFSSREHLIQA